MPGELQAQVRSFSMTTLNRPEFRDFSTVAFGGSLGYTTPQFKGLSASAKFHYSTEIWSNDLLDPDPLSGKISKWEVELYDIADPDHRRDVMRLSEAFLQFRNAKWNVKLGRQSLNTPLFNERDGRMMPFNFGALYGTYKQNKNWSFDLGYVYSASVRGFSSWNDLDGTIGLVSRGVSTTGDPVKYLDSTGCSGAGIAKVAWKGKEQQLQFWAFYMDRLNTTFWTEWTAMRAPWTAGIQSVIQIPSANASQVYLQGSGNSQVLSGKIGHSWPRKGKVTAAFTWITNSGKFLFPRELGREKLYTSMPRSWVEGNGNLMAASLGWTYRWSASGGWRARTKVAYIKPDVATNFEMNKYGHKEQLQWNVQVRYAPEKWSEHFNVELLYLINRTVDASYYAASKEINRRNFQEINVIANYTLKHTS